MLRLRSGCQIGMLACGTCSTKTFAKEFKLSERPPPRNPEDKIQIS